MDEILCLIDGWVSTLTELRVVTCSEFIPPSARQRCRASVATTFRLPNLYHKLQKWMDP